MENMHKELTFWATEKKTFTVRHREEERSALSTVYFDVFYVQHKFHSCPAVRLSRIIFTSRYQRYPGSINATQVLLTLLWSNERYPGSINAALVQ
jgi:hypothetical protein